MDVPMMRQALQKVFFTGINFYARHYDVTDAYYNELIQAGRDAGLGVYMDHGEGRYAGWSVVGWLSGGCFGR